MANNYLRQVNTVPNFGVDLLFNGKEGIATSTVATGHKIPAGKVILGVIYRNIENDLTAGASGTVLAQVGSTAIGSAQAVSGIKGTAVAVILDSPIVVTSSTEEVKLTVGTAGITGGTLDVVILYV